MASFSLCLKIEAIIWMSAVQPHLQMFFYDSVDNMLTILKCSLYSENKIENMYILGLEIWYIILVNHNAFLSHKSWIFTNLCIDQI